MTDGKQSGPVMTSLIYIVYKSSDQLDHTSQQWTTWQLLLVAAPLCSLHSVPECYQDWQPLVVLSSFVRDLLAEGAAAFLLLLFSQCSKDIPPLLFLVFSPIERKRIPSAGNTVCPAATQEALNSCWSVPSVGKPSNSVGTMWVLKHNSAA